MFLNKLVKLCVASTVLGKLKGTGKFVNKDWKSDARKK